MQKINYIYLKYRKQILYIIFGFLTTLTNIIVYALSHHIFNISVMISTIIAWLVSVLFAYITNKQYVFINNENSLSANLLQMVKFYLSRLTSGAVDLLIMMIFVSYLHINDLFVKVVSNLIVIILNYILSEFFVFKNSNGGD